MGKVGFRVSKMYTVRSIHEAAIMVRSYFNQSIHVISILVGAKKVCEGDGEVMFVMEMEPSVEEEAKRDGEWGDHATLVTGW